jgi:hypothetical protein
MGFALLLPFLLMALFVILIPVELSRRRARQRAYWRGLSPPRERLPESPTCPRCRWAMARGYLLDQAQGGFGMGTWIEGQPVRSGWSNLIRPPRLERSIPIVSYRCTGCGYLELYARPELVEELDRGKPAGYPEL